MQKQGFIKFIIVFLLAAFFLVILAALTIKTFRVAGEAMSPTLVDGQKIIINKLAYAWSNPERGDIIVIGSVKPIIRRIVGLPGEKVEIKSGKVNVDGKPLNESYLKNSGANDFNEEEISIDPAHFLVLADNRSSSYYKGQNISILALVPKNEIVGKYWLKY